MNEPHTEPAKPATDPNIVTSAEDLDAMLEAAKTTEGETTTETVEKTAVTKDTKAAKVEPKKEGEATDEEEDGVGVGKVRRALVAREQKVEAKRAELRSQAEALENERQQFRRDMGSFVEERGLAKKDPVTYLRKVHGWTDKQIAERLMNNGEPPAEEQQSAKEAEYDRRIQALEERERRAEAAKVTESRNAAERQVMNMFATKVSSDAEDRWPLLAGGYTEAEIGQMGLSLFYEAHQTLAAEAKRKGVANPVMPQYSDEQIADALEARERARDERRQARSGAKTGASGQSAKTEIMAGNTAAGHEAAGTKPVPTLTGKTASAKPLTTPVDPLSLSDEESDLLALAAIKEARKTA